MTPSFFSLFKRGRYYRFKPFNPSARIRNDKAADEKERKEAERFAVAAIAFAAKHDPSFRRQFWKRVCWVKGDPPLCNSPEILVEPAHWADLLIINPTKADRYAYVIECKIRAGLSGAQNPAKRAFGGHNGYGFLFCNDERTAQSQLRFCVLGCRRTSDSDRFVRVFDAIGLTTLA